ncbi:MAG: RNase adapter RapZ [Atopobium sp.]|uniref:RNase adapter RapZ n=1 Tax=Atopobium sp. TaxID=1872650 RepID=UPI002A83AB92|nr:RNase adapter RapZ [Atopobium sp.]MDY4523285.1 RNase adapter RapZ [Atopobium sp.]
MANASKTKVPDIVVITGMSGAGRTEAMHIFEDLGYYVIDNLPPELMLTLAKIVGINSGIGRHLAIVCDLRSQGLFDELLDKLDSLADHEITYSLMFLDSSDEVLRRRFSERRRRHPIANEGEDTIHAIRRERKQLTEVRNRADMVLDTSKMRTSTLRNKIRARYSELSDTQLMEVYVFSFGFKYGMPVEADILIDVRFLPNPYYDPAMRKLTGQDKMVSDFVMERPETKKFLAAWENLLDSVMPGYVSEGKPQLSIAVGCTGGQHRSVTLATQTAQYLAKQGYQVNLSHRDLPRANTN